MSNKVKVIIGGREKVIDRRLARALIRMDRAKEFSEEVPQTYKTRMLVAEKPRQETAKKTEQDADKREELKKKLDDAGVQYNKRLGEAKLQELVDNLKA